MEILIDILPHRNDNAYAVIKQAVATASANLMPVRFCFHRVTAIILPGDTVDQALADWTDNFDSLNMLGSATDAA